MKDRRPIPDVLPVFPADPAVLPLEIVPLGVRSAETQALVDDVMRSDRLLACVVRRAGGSLAEVGTAAVVHRLARQPDGSTRLLLQGLERIRVGARVREAPYLVARVQPYPEHDEGGAELEATARAIQALFAEQVGRSPQLVDLVGRLAGDRAEMAYLVAAQLELTPAERQEILEADPVGAKLRRVLELLQHDRAVSELRDKIERETRTQLDRAQREAILREQLRTIQRELGGTGGEGVEDLRARLAEANLPPEVAQEVERELPRLERLPEHAAEHGIIRTHLEWLLELPWRRFSAEPIDLVRAQAVLDEDHHDLEKVKERIVEHLAVKKLRDERQPAEPEDEEQREPILCLVGPPGVGKTSLGQSIARAMGRGFTRISLGGVHDESEIRGHRRTYVGAMPGRIVQALRRVGVADPVFMLDEIDKLGFGFQGDPAAALLEVLDPAQNRHFVDGYLGVPVDLSTVFFICTANRADTIPGALRDRMETIALSGYTEAEKLGIATRHLLPRLLRAHGLRPDEVVVGDDALARMVREHTREAGVRELERVLARALRRVARRIGQGEAGPLTIRAEDLEALVGRPRYRQDLAERIDRPGIALGLAWTPSGGEVMFIEAALLPSRDGGLILTGMLGDVMRESAQAALSYLKANGPQVGIPRGAFEGKSVHLHVPAGATPKDGPSAGVAMLTALASLASGAVVRDDTAMTGEITLRGKVTPVGGIKEKVLAAHRQGLRAVILPRGNQDDLDDVPAEVRARLRIELVDSVDQVLGLALALPPEERRPHEDEEAPGPH